MPTYTFGSWQKRMEFYQEEIKKTFDQKKEVLFLNPEISSLKKTFSFLEKNFFNQLIVLHSDLKKSEFLKNWQRIFEKENNEPLLVLGTRSALFSPFKNLGLVIFDQEENVNYKQYDRSPFYHSREVALKLTEIWKGKIIFGSEIPSLEAYQQIVEKRWKLIQLKDFKTKFFQPDVVDLNQEKLKGNFSFLSDLFLEKIEKNLKEKKKVFLFVNRKGLANFIFCQDCGWTEKCPNCHLPLVAHQNHLTCHHCNFSKQVSLTCPSCKGTEIKFYGLGTQKIEKEIKKIFSKTEILRIDQDFVFSEKKSDFSEKINKAKIIIGTRMAFSYPLPKFGLGGFVLIDQLLNLPDFRTFERTFQMAWKLKNLSEEFIIQTYNPQCFLIQSLAKNDLKSFYQKEIEQRKSAGYPPFGRLIRLIYRDKDLEQVKKRGEEEFARLKKNLFKLENKKKLSVFGPTFFPKEHNKYRVQIVIKMDFVETPKLGVSTGMLMGTVETSKLGVSTDWKIDVDPESLI